MFLYCCPVDLERDIDFVSNFVRRIESRVLSTVDRFDLKNVLLRNDTTAVWRLLIIPTSALWIFLSFHSFESLCDPTLSEIIPRTIGSAEFE